MDDDDAVSAFRECLRIKSVSGDGPSGSYARMCDWIEAFAKTLRDNVEIFRKEYVAGKPVLLVTLPGTRPDLPSLLLNAHYDVVPADLSKWTQAPFDADIVTAEGSGEKRVYARGTQDMKIVLVAYLVALKRLSSSSSRNERTVHVSFVPDEEIGGKDGMLAFLRSPDFEERVRPVKLALDEGLANPAANKFTVFYGERVPYWLLLRSTGPTGHGSRFIDRTAIEKLIRFCKTAYDFRAEERAKLGTGGCAHCQAKKLGDVVTLNVTMLDAKTPMSTTPGDDRAALNVIPTEARCGIDMRIPPSIPLSVVHDKLDAWCSENDMTWEHAPWTPQPDTLDHCVSSTREDDPVWRTFIDGVQSFDADITVVPEVFPAGTDSRFLREAGIPAYGFSPMRGTPVLLHEHDEYITVDVFLEAVRAYEALLPALYARDYGEGDDAVEGDGAPTANGSTKRRKR